MSILKSNLWCSNNVIISGSHRSGTTWVASILYSSGNYVYVDEPLNPLNKNFFYKPNFWYDDLTGTNVELKQIGRQFGVVRDRFWFHKELKKSSSIQYTTGLLKSYLLRKPALIKDPLSFFSLPFLYNELGVKPILLIRHPLAFIGSLKRLNWNFDFSELLLQHDLMNRLKSFRSQMEERVRDKDNLVDNGILLWNIIHTEIIGYQKRYPSWNFVIHEQLSSNPQKEFRKLCQSIGLKFSKKIKRTIDKTTSESMVRDLGSEVHVVNRNSLVNIDSWRNRLSAEEVNIILQKTEYVAGHFYRD